MPIRETPPPDKYADPLAHEIYEMVKGELSFVRKYGVHTTGGYRNTDVIPGPERINDLRQYIKAHENSTCYQHICGVEYARLVLEGLRKK